jgi:hypothetical protein
MQKLTPPSPNPFLLVRRKRKNNKIYTNKKIPLFLFKALRGAYNI